MMLKPRDTYMGLYGHPSAANQEAYITLLGIVENPNERIDWRVVVETDRHVKSRLLEFLETVDVRILQRNAVVGHNGYLSLNREQGAN